MQFDNPKIQEAYLKLKNELDLLKNKNDIIRSPILKNLYDELKSLTPDKRASFGLQVNRLRDELLIMVSSFNSNIKKDPVDISAPFDDNVATDLQPDFLSAQTGSRHPLMIELNYILDIFYRMGFEALESFEIDDDYHMFGSLNFPEGHPARDDFDTFLIDEVDKEGRHFISPAHTSSMQNRVLQSKASLLDNNEPIAAVSAGRVFRNEDLDARHEHTFYQLEGVYVSNNVTVGNLMATLKTFLESYYDKSLKFKTQPSYFPFTEPSFEFVLSCPFCEGQGCHICSKSGWIELLGCGMIHPNVLKMAGIDSEKYSGFAWGMGIERLVMMKYNIEDIRHFEAGKLNFLRQFK